LFLTLFIGWFEMKFTRPPRKGHPNRSFHVSKRIRVPESILSRVTINGKEHLLNYICTITNGIPQISIHSEQKGSSKQIGLIHPEHTIITDPQFRRKKIMSNALRISDKLIKKHAPRFKGASFLGTVRGEDSIIRRTSTFNVVKLMLKNGYALQSLKPMYEKK
jgi:hypothetical protein